MAAAAAMGKPHGMLSVIGLSDADLESVCKEVRQSMGADTVCQLANYLFPQVSLTCDQCTDLAGIRQSCRPTSTNLISN